MYIFSIKIDIFEVKVPLNILREANECRLPDESVASASFNRHVLPRAQFNSLITGEVDNVESR